MKVPAKTLPASILHHARSLPEGGVLSPKEFLHLGSRVAVDQAFSRLMKAGKLLRVVRGTYVAPVSGRFGSRPPAPVKVIKSLAQQSGELVAPHVASAANALGLTQQVPIREVYLTSGRTRMLKLGRSEVLIKHVPRWMLALGSGPAGAADRREALEHVRAETGQPTHLLEKDVWVVWTLRTLFDSPGTVELLPPFPTRRLCIR